jgi:hypothetical protein
MKFHSDKFGLDHLHNRTIIDVYDLEEWCEENSKA